MPGTVLRVVPKRALSFAGVAVGGTQDVVLADRIDLTGWPGVTLLARIHSHSIASGAGNISIMALPLGHTQEEPGIQFVGDLVPPAQAVINDASPSPGYFTAPVNAIGPMARIIARGTRAAAGGLDATVSVDLSVTDTAPLGAAVGAGAGPLNAISVTLAATASDYDPTGFSAADVVRVTLTGNQSLTGMAAPTGAAKVRKILENVDTVDNLTLAHQATSAAANQFKLPQGLSIVLGPGEAIEVWYDPTLQKWVPVAETGQLYNAVSAWFRQELSNGSVSSSATITFKNAQKQSVTLTGNATLTLAFPGVGNYLLRVVQDGTGGRTPTLSVSGGSVLRPGGSLVFTSAANARDILNLYYNGTDVYATLVPDFQ